MTNYFGNSYGGYPQPQYNNLFAQPTQPQIQMQQPTIIFVSNIAEANTTKPDVTGKPLFFYNKADEEFYIKKYDDYGLAPLKTYKLVVENAKPVTNPFEEGFKSLDSKLDDIKKLLTPTQTQSQQTQNYEDRKNRR